eukprot:m.89052 g.89052  ORF g.89052 m.89052 type:complete len:432 (-) comp16436_c0_seq2:154-1449(-)
MPPKHGFLTAKAIGNRIKSKGLQKLRWFCQMCSKQCRDENGFKCHTMSESHQRMLLLVAETPEKFVDQFSADFEKAFMDQLKRTKNTKRVSASMFYNEYIADKEHLHMNSTKWSTLTEFVKYLGREGKCIVDETPKGWYIKYIDRDPEVVARQKELERREKLEKDDDEREAKLLAERIQRDKEAAARRGETLDEPQATELKRADDSEKIGFAVPSRRAETDGSSGASNASGGVGAFKSQLKALSAKATPKSGSESRDTGSSKKRKKSALELIKEEEEARKRKKELAARTSSVAAASKDVSQGARKDYWLKKGIVVKVLNKKLAGGKYYKCKGVVIEVVQRYGGKIRVQPSDPSESAKLLTLDQNDVETVIPKAGGLVLVVNGVYRGYEATLEAIHTKTFSCTIKLHSDSGAHGGKVVSDVAYEDICKLQLE